MSNWGLGGACLLGRSSEVTATTGASGSVYGSYVELFASTPRGVEGVIFHATNASSNFRTLVTIGIGAAGSEVEIATDIPITWWNSSFAHSTWLPVRVPPGVRLAFKVLSNSVTNTRAAFVELLGTGGLHPLGCSRLIGYGHTSGAVGTSVTAGASGAFGTSVQLVASTPRDARMIGHGVLGDQNNVELRGCVGTFAGAGAIEIAPRVGVHVSQSENHGAPLLRPIFVPCHIPAGTDVRVALANYNAANPRRGVFVILGY